MPVICTTIKTRIMSHTQESLKRRIIKKVHRVLEFNQETWLGHYVDMNTVLRIKVKNDFEKDLFKLMNMERLWKDYGKF